MWILLTNSNKHDWLASRVDHIKCSPHLLVNSIKLGQDDAINCSRVLNAYCEVNQTLVELSQLVNSVVSYESFAHKQHDIRLINVD